MPLLPDQSRPGLVAPDPIIQPEYKAWHNKLVEEAHRQRRERAQERPGQVKVRIGKCG